MVVFTPSKATVHGVVAEADACVIACFTVAIYPWFNGRLKQISCCSLFANSELFNSVERTITSISIGLKVGWEGRVAWQRQEWFALKQFKILNFMHLSFTNVKQSKLNFRIYIDGDLGCYLLNVN